jgi:Ion transport protein
MINAFITLFTQSTTAGWAEMTVYTISSQDVDYIPDFSKKRIEWLLFFMLFMIVCSFFFMNLFGAVVINTFMAESDRIGGGALLTMR